MKNEDMPAAPLTLEDGWGDPDCMGLTKFEYACIHIAAGISGEVDPRNFSEAIAYNAVKVARRLFDEMEKAK